VEWKRLVRPGDSLSDSSAHPGFCRSRISSDRRGLGPDFHFVRGLPGPSSRGGAGGTARLVVAVHLLLAFLGFGDHHGGAHREIQRGSILAVDLAVHPGCAGVGAAHRVSVFLRMIRALMRCDMFPYDLTEEKLLTGERHPFII